MRDLIVGVVNVEDVKKKTNGFARRGPIIFSPSVSDMLQHIQDALR